MHQRMPFHKLVAVLNPPREPGCTPLTSINFTVLFTVLRDLMDDKNYGGFYLNALPSLSTGALYDFNFYMVHWPQGWRIAMEYKPDLFEKQTAERLHGFLMAAFEYAISNPDARLSSLDPPVRDRIARPKTIDGFAANDASRPPPSAPPIVEPTEAETRMIAIWRDVLQVREIAPRRISSTSAGIP